MKRILFVFFLMSVAANIEASPQASAQEPAKKPDSPRPAAALAAAPTALEARVEKFMRNLYAWGPDFTLNVGPAKPSQVQGLIEVPVKVVKAEQSDSAIVYVSTDGNFLFRGDIQDMRLDPLASVRLSLHTDGAPSKGPADATVTLVEFADFECPSCRQLDLILRNLLPKYPKVRLVYKDYPILDLHPWSMTAAIAGHCANVQKPDAFWKMHDAIFDAQDVISPDNAWDKMVDLAAQLGLDQQAFKTCMASPDSTQAVHKSMDEGHNLNVNNTPTIFVNGRRIIGPDENLLIQFITYDLVR